MVYNCCLFSFSQTQLTEAEHLLTHSLERGMKHVHTHTGRKHTHLSLPSSPISLTSLPILCAALGAVGCDRPPPNPPVFWCMVLKSLGSTPSLRSCALHLLCLSWALWLSTCSLGHIQELQVVCVCVTNLLLDFSVCKTLGLVY